jgi:hypothetical protein
MTGGAIAEQFTYRDLAAHAALGLALLRELLRRSASR